ncbi:MAG: hypothetical protein LBR35_02525 [Rickettsiales bacterium]|jgi:outer membrane protein assembly factor BamE (lipoprotein component of BamABCDE complex)|nr:hypothetical protein [Rickettsiales bacterium]
MKKIIISLFALTLLPACTTPKETIAPQKSNLTYAMVKSKIIKGQTTQNEIISLFGSPNIITKNSDGHEVWTYSKQSSDKSAQSSSFGAGIPLFIGYGSASSSSSKTITNFDLIITFDKNDVVKDYSVLSSQF